MLPANRCGPDAGIAPGSAGGPFGRDDAPGAYFDWATVTSAGRSTRSAIT
jgi:hypothetical protein